MSERPYDICGWATKFNVPCADGRTIRPGSFDDCDGKKVPLVWQHMRDDPKNVLGHAILHSRPEGVWTEAWFNDSPTAEDAKRLIQHGDIDAFSIYANKLKHKGHDVLHGIIREVSLVLAGANPEALIEFPVLEHGDGSEVEDEAVIYSHGEIVNSDEASETPEEPETEDTLAHSAEEFQEPEQPRMVFRPLARPIPLAALQQPYMSYQPAPMPLKNTLEHAAPMDAAPPVKQTVTTTTITKQEDDNMPAERTVRDVFNGMTDEQKNVVYFILGEMLNEFGSEDTEMKHNAFESAAPAAAPRVSLTAEDYKSIFTLAKKEGSLKAGVEEFVAQRGEELSHDAYNADGTKQTYGIADIDMLFPDYKNVTDRPEWIKRDMDWVGVVMDGVTNVPITRIKSQFANLTADEARAKGYVKGNRKVEQVFTLLKRTTDPQTIYKKQKMDKDDISDIIDFDVVAWIKGEMRQLLDEEIARAILVGDGRQAIDDDKISPDHIRPIWGDDDLFTIRANVKAGADDAATAKALIRKAIKARKDYKGSGNLTFFTTEDWLTEMLLLEDGIGHPLYADATALARKLRVNKIVTVPVMENLANGNEKLAGIIVDMKDYRVGHNKGAGVDLFDDFDIDYNQYKYLIETRLSGALTKPFSAIALTINGTDYAYEETDDYTGSPKAKGYYEKNGTIYRPSQDTEVVEGKTYYEKVAQE